MNIAQTKTIAMPSKRISLLFMVLWSLNGVLLFGQEISSRPIVLLDPGHGGIDSGAVGVNCLLEKNVVLEVAKEVVRLDRELFKESLDVYLTRYSDTLISLRDRTRLAKSLSADLYLSLHCNKAERVAAQGVEVYIHSNGGFPFRKKAIAFGTLLGTGFHQKVGLRDRGIKLANFQVLRDTRSVCPALLLEFGFLSNPEEALFLGNPKSRTAMALAILETIKEILNHG